MSISMDVCSVHQGECESFHIARRPSISCAGTFIRFSSTVQGGAVRGRQSLYGGAFADETFEVPATSQPLPVRALNITYHAAGARTQG